MRVKLTVNAKIKVDGKLGDRFAVAGEIIDAGSKKKAEDLIKRGVAEQLSENDLAEEVDTEADEAPEPAGDEPYDIDSNVLDDLGFVEPEDRIEDEGKGKIKGKSKK